MYWGNCWSPYQWAACCTVLLLFQHSKLNKYSIQMPLCAKINYKIHFLCSHWKLKCNRWTACVYLYIYTLTNCSQLIIVERFERSLIQRPWSILIHIDYIDWHHLILITLKCVQCKIYSSFSYFLESTKMDWASAL